MFREALTVMSHSTGTDLSFAAAEEERLRITDTDHYLVASHHKIHKKLKILQKWPLFFTEGLTP